MSPQLVDVDDKNVEFNLNTERLYPHDTDCFLVVVPKQFKIQNFLKKVILNGDVQSIFCALVAFALVRIIIQRADSDEWFSITYKTLQFFLIQGQMVNRNSIEAAWNIILRGFSVIAISTTSAILYNSLVNIQHHEIDSIEDLISSNLTVFIPESSKSQFDDLNIK